jgi:hypothetical protein
MNRAKATPTRQLIRHCPKCKGTMGIVITEPVRHNILGLCIDCGYAIRWRASAVERSNILKSLMERGFTASSRSARKTSV